MMEQILCFVQVDTKTLVLVTYSPLSDSAHPTLPPIYIYVPSVCIWLGCSRLSSGWPT